MNTLKLTLKKKWFDMILSGEKKEEYREIKPYWDRRFNIIEADYGEWKKTPGIYPNKMTIPLTFTKRFYDRVEFRNGYSPKSPMVKLECLGIDGGYARPEWSDNWKGEVYVIKLGRILETKHLKN